MGVKSPSPGHTSNCQRQDFNPGIWRLQYHTPKKWHHRYGKPTLGLPLLGQKIPAETQGNHWISIMILWLRRIPMTWPPVTQKTQVCFDVGDFMWVKPLAETIPE